MRLVSYFFHFSCLSAVSSQKHQDGEHHHRHEITVVNCATQRLSCHSSTRRLGIYSRAQQVQPPSIRNVKNSSPSPPSQCKRDASQKEEFSSTTQSTLPFPLPPGTDRKNIVIKTRSNSSDHHFHLSPVEVKVIQVIQVIQVHYKLRSVDHVQNI